MLRTVFMGTPDFALPSLETAQKSSELQLVVTQPDRPAGRGRKLRSPVVKERALEFGIDVAQPEKSVTRELAEDLARLEPDVIIVAAFGKILGRKVLSIPRLGCINVHASLLPRHRGASPPAWAILRGDEETGVTVQRMVLEMDAGDVLAQRSTPIAPNETTGELTERLSHLGADLLGELLTELEGGMLDGRPQNHADATFAPPLSKQDGKIDWSKPAMAVHDHIRAMNPWPVAFTSCPKGRLRIHRTCVHSVDEVAGEPGEVVRADPGAVHIACGRGVLQMVEAQHEGKRVMCSKDLVCGRMIGTQERLGTKLG